MIAVAGQGRDLTSDDRLIHPGLVPRGRGREDEDGVGLGRRSARVRGLHDERVRPGERRDSGDLPALQRQPGREATAHDAPGGAGGGREHRVVGLAHEARARGHGGGGDGRGRARPPTDAPMEAAKIAAATMTTTPCLRCIRTDAPRHNRSRPLGIASFVAYRSWMQDPATRAGELIAKIDDRTGQGRRRRAGLRRAAGRDARGRGRVPGRRLRRRSRARRRARSRSLVRGGRLRRRSSRPRSPPATVPTCDADDLRDFDVAVITVQTPLRDERPRPLVHRGGGARPRRVAHAGRARGARVDDVSRHDRRVAAPDPRGVGSARRRRRLLLRLLARAHRSRQHRVDVREHGEGRLGHRRAVARRSSKRSTARSSTRSCPSARPARPSSSSCSRTRSAT